MTGNPGTGPLYILTQKIFDLMTEYVLISVPLFIFMAALLERSGVAKQMYDALDFWLSRVRGGVAIVTSLMAVLMAAMSGIIGGEVVLLGLIALPQMLRLGYNQNLAIGTICASGSLGTMIPPSIVLIIFGLITETSIKALFTAAFMPGFMLASMIIIYIVIRTQLHPDDAPLPEPRRMIPPPSRSSACSAPSCHLVHRLRRPPVPACARLSDTDRRERGARGRREAVLARHEPSSALACRCGRRRWRSLFSSSFSAKQRRAFLAWEHGKGLVPPFLVIGVVLGSIYGGVTGITEAAGMGALAVFMIAAVPWRGLGGSGVGQPDAHAEIHGHDHLGDDRGQLLLPAPTRSPVGRASSPS